ncbi:PRC-barrel domain-containing protein [Calidifontibacillus erzurumensis]|uniref:PRC-barrel domain-containing protein n=1 Tax=Calidifontibacillus erzurumensis TaxID=2741433 RepID=A0A8J8GA84_9BACI|nr:PRC-barrel domain-containing protein [Calidifontibacillus erzurumensis]NSL50190.1 PRC-barrel domain-containing protein [Calidifontibacillus erzurumensis]
MRTFSSVKDLPVYSEVSGKELGRVYDLCLDKNGTVNGLIIDPKGLLKKNKFIPLSEVSSFGLDGVMVKDEQKAERITDKLVGLYFLENGKDHIIGKPLVTTEGDKLGLVEDVYFLEEMGTIIGYEVTDGFFADMTEGRKVYKTKKPLTIGENILIVDLTN